MRVVAASHDESDLRFLLKKLNADERDKETSYEMEESVYFDSEDIRQLLLTSRYAVDIIKE